jgi:Sec-independent protein translocase protein TatA
VLLLFFGKDKLPGLARSIGQAFKELKSGFVDSANAEKEKGGGTTKKS